LYVAIAFAQKLLHTRGVQSDRRRCAPGVRYLTQITRVRIRDADNQTRQHLRVRRQGALDLGGVDVAAARSEHVDPAVGQVQEPVGVEVAEVASESQPSRLFASTPT